MGNPTEPPAHLERITELFERIERGEEVRALVSVPPQHGKTETLLHGIARSLARHPEWPFVYVSFTATAAGDKSRIARDYARAAGVELREDADAVGTWLTPLGGGLRARGIGGPLSGSPAKVLVVDDPHKDRADAESALMRQRVYDWFTSTAMSRLHPGSSAIVVHTRWHPDDLIGKLSKEKKPDGHGGEVPVWEVINLPAILPNGQPLWYRRPLSFLEQHQRANEYDWHSLWMGDPRGRGDSVFRGVRYYDRLPERYAVGKGIDLAYTSKKVACFSCGVVLLEHDGLCYVVDVRRKQCEVRAFADELEGVVWPGSWHWFSSTTEKGVADLLTDRGVPVEAVLASTDKFSRAQWVAAAWNEGRILVPREAPWLRAFVDEIGSFTGVADKSDDQVDALASAFEAVRYGGKVEAKTLPDSDSRWEDDARGFG